MIARMEGGGEDHLVLVNLGTEIREEVEEGRREEGGEGGVKKKWTSRAQLRNTARLPERCWRFDTSRRREVPGSYSYYLEFQFQGPCRGSL